MATIVEYAKKHGLTVQFVTQLYRAKRLDCTVKDGIVFIPINSVPLPSRGFGRPIENLCKSCNLPNKMVAKFCIKCGSKLK